MKPSISAVFFLYCLSFTLLSSLLAQGEFGDLLGKYRRQQVPEKVFVHTDKDVYAGGEIVWAAVYLTDGQSHRPDSLSKLIHLELRNAQDEIIKHIKLFPFDGHSAGDFSLPADIIPGTYQLTAYTNFQRNGPPSGIFRKSIQVVSGLAESGGVARPETGATTSPSGLPNAEVQLRFFPEGGDCIAGIPCRVAVYAEQPDSGPMATEGYLAGPSGEAQTFFRTSENGVGTFTYTPSRGEAATVVVGSNKQSFNLPIPLAEGYHLKVYEHKDTFRVQLATNFNDGLNSSTLVIHLRGVPLLERTIMSREPEATFRIPRNEIPPGVAVATLFDGWGEPVAERLFFISPQTEDARILLTPDRDIYGSRERIDLTLGFPNPGFTMDSSLAGRMSLSVVPARIGQLSGSDDIRSWLLLNSDLDRPIPEATELIFDTEGRVSAQRIEELLLTRGWRRFRWEQLRKKDQQPAFLMEDGVYLQGRMTKYDNREAARPGKVFLTRLENGFIDQVMTDEEGYFLFGPYRTFDTLEVDLQGRFRAGKRNRLNPKIDLDDNPYVNLTIQDPPGPELPPPNPLTTESSTGSSILEDYQEMSRKSLTVARNYDSLIIDLDVVDITAERIDKVKEERIQRTQLYQEPDSRIDVDSIGWAQNVSSVLSLLRTVPGVQVTGNQGQEVVRIRGNTSITLSNDPAFFIDGTPVTLEAVRTIPIQVVEFIDVIRGARSSILGINGGGGAVLLYTRRGGTGEFSPEPGVLRTYFKGYHKAREFAVFDADLPENRNRPDLRTTLHWNPQIRTNLLGNAVESFFASDQTGRFIIIAQGLRNDGRPYFGTTEIRVDDQ